MREFIDTLLNLYSDRPYRIAVAQVHPKYVPFMVVEDMPIDKILLMAETRDVFISPMFDDLFVFTTVDLDNGLPKEWHEEPDYLTKTSDDHYQAIWLCDEPLNALEWRRAQKRLKDLYKADCAYHPEYVARIPGSFNFKRNQPTEAL